MFGILKTENRKEGLINCLRYFFNKPEPELKKITVKNGAPFFLLKVIKDKNGEVDYEEICKILGRCAKRLVVSCDEDVKETDCIGLFKPDILPDLILFNSGVRLAGAYVKDKGDNKLTVGIIDLNAALKERMIPLVQLFNNIKVITQKPQNYEPVCEKILDEWGLPVLITDSESSISDCDFIFSPFKSENSVLSNCIAIRNRENGSLTKFAGEGITLPREYSELIPENVDALIFASALFELCGVTALSNLCFDKMKRI